MLLSLKARPEPEPSPAQRMVLLVLSLVLTLVLTLRARARENVAPSGKEDLDLPLAGLGDLPDMPAKESWRGGGEGGPIQLGGAVWAKETKSLPAPLLCGRSVGRCIVMGRALLRWRLAQPFAPDGPNCGELVGHNTLSFKSASMNVVAFTSCPVRQFLSTQEEGSSMAS